MKYLSIILISIVFISCSSSEMILKTSEGKVKLPIPPGTLKVSDNFYVDKTEVTNISYLEYIYWNMRVFGQGTKEYIDCLPDTTVFNISSVSNVVQAKSHQYFKHGTYSNHPTIGISFQQAKSYSKWRSDRVFEYILIKNNLYKPIPKVNSTNYFSIEKYYNGEISGVTPNKSIPYPVYRLPSKEEWLNILKNELTIKEPPLRQAKSTDSLDFPTEDVYTYLQKKTIGGFKWNISEMTSSEGIAMGKSWRSINKNVKPEEFSYVKPEPWLGFRNVCTWQYNKTE